MIHFCTLLFRFFKMSDSDLRLFVNKSYKKVCEKNCQIEATLLTQWLVSKGWKDSALTRTEPLTEGLGVGKDLLFESILGRCVSSNKKLKVKNGCYVKIWWGAHIPIRTNGPAIILSGMDLFATWWNWKFSLQEDNRMPQISSTLHFSNLCFTKLCAHYLIVNIYNFCTITSKE